MGPVPINDTPPPPPLINDQIGFLVQKDSQCSEIYKKQFSYLYFLEKWLTLYSNFNKIRTDLCEPDSEMPTNITR